MRILFLSRWFPYPPDNGSRIRIYNLLRSLSTRHCLDLISFTDDVEGAQNFPEQLERWIERVKVVPYHSFHPRRWKAVMGYFSQKPRSVIDTFSVAMKDAVLDFAKSSAYDVVIATQIDMVPYLRILQNQCALLEELELGSLYDKTQQTRLSYRKTRSKLTWWKLSNYLGELPAIIRGCTVVSEKEKELCEDALNGTIPIEVIPNGVDLDYYSGDFGALEANSLVYSGALAYRANFDAVSYFLAEIYPIIQAEIPQVKLYVTGKVNDVPLERLPAREGVIFTGYLQDIRPRVAQSWVSVVPLRVGGGTRLKILESLALGTPVVSTSKGAEGLELIPGSDLFIADQPAEFAQKVISILRDRNMRDRIGTQGRDTVNERYSWAGIGAKFNQFIEEIVHITTGAREYGAH